MTARRGFAMLTVLWLVIGIGTMVAVAGLAAQRAIGLAQREHDRAVGRWAAEGCIAQTRATVDGALARVQRRADATWRALDTVIAGLGPGFGGCDLGIKTEGRVIIDRATVAELDSLPGMSPEAVAMVLRTRAAGVPITDLASIAGRLSPEARARFEAGYAAFVQRATADPDVWVVRSRAHVGVPPTPANIEVALTRAGSHVTVTRWREW